MVNYLNFNVSHVYMYSHSLTHCCNTVVYFGALHHPDPLSTFSGNTLIYALSNVAFDTPANNNQLLYNVNRVVLFSLIVYTANKEWVSQLVKMLSPLPLPLSSLGARCPPLSAPPSGLPPRVVCAPAPSHFPPCFLSTSTILLFDCK